MRARGGTNMRHRVSILLAAFLAAIFVFSLDDGRASASHTCAAGPSVCGQNSGLVPFHKDAILASLIWPNAKTGCPKMAIWMRPSEYKPKDYLNPTLGGVFSGFNPKYLELVQGGFGLTQLDRSGWSRYAPDLERENAQLIDVCGLQESIDSEKFTKASIATLTDADIVLTDPFFQDAGYSRGLSYNLFCMGQEAGIDGRLYVFGLHDKGGNNGGRKVNIFDSKTEQWVWRGTTCVRSGWETDPTGTIAPHCDPLDETNTDPPLAADRKRQRWHPTTVTLPDGRFLMLSWTEPDTGGGRASNHWTHVAKALNAHEGAASALKVRIFADGTWSQEVFSFGGDNGSGSDEVGMVEKINFSDPIPAWQRLSDLVLPATQNNMVILPDGKLLVVGGRGAGVNTLHYQMFDPADGSRTDLIESSVPRHDHSTALLQPNGGVWVMGGNRVQLIPGGNENLAIPVTEFYQPPYFFKGPRPVIEKTPYRLHYGKTFKLRVSRGEIGSVAILRTGPVTHNWTWGNRYVELPFEAGEHGRLDGMAPPLPGLAIAGDYLLFVVNKDGVPSEGKHIRLRPSDEQLEDEDDHEHGA